MTKNRVSSNAADAPAHTLVFKICDRAAWEEASTSGLYHGSPDDARDGYIHFSTPQQLAATAAKYFRHVPNLVLVAVDPGRLPVPLRWEPARGGDLFPHLYAPLPTAASLWITPLPLGPDGVPVLPATVATSP